jgi:hypothetical protein
MRASETEPSNDSDGILGRLSLSLVRGLRQRPTAMSRRLHPDLFVPCSASEIVVVDSPAEPLLLVGHQNSHRVSILVLKLDPDGV